MRINENMFGESGAVVNNDLYLHRVLPLDKPIVSGQNYTISGWIMPGETKTTIYLYNSDPRTVEVRISLTDITGYFSHTFTATEKERINKYINMYLSPSAEVSRSESYKIKLEEGTEATMWIPANSDLTEVQQSTLPTWGGGIGKSSKLSNTTKAQVVLC